MPNPVPLPALPAQTNTVQVVIKSPEEQEKESTAQKGKAKFALASCGGTWDFENSTVSGITYPVLSKQIDDIFDLPRSARAPELVALLQRAHRLAKEGDQLSALCTQSSIVVVQKTLAAIFLLGNFRTEPMDSTHGKASSIDRTAYMAQTNRHRAQIVMLFEERRSNETNMDVHISQA